MVDIGETEAKRLKETTVLIAVLMARNPQRMFMEAYVDTVLNLKDCGIQFRMLTLGGCSDLAYARNMVAAKFLKSVCTDLVWIDDDVAFESSDIVKLLISEHDVIGGGYRKKLDNYAHDDPLSWCCKALEGVPVELDKTGAMKIDKVGMGFLKTSRRCFERILETVDIPYRHDDDADITFHRFFHFDGLGHSEDYSFCDLCRDAGMDIWVDPSIRLAHVGEHAYIGDIAPMIEAAAKRKASDGIELHAGAGAQEPAESDALDGPARCRELGLLDGCV